jgi:ribosomal protein L21
MGNEIESSQVEKELLETLDKNAFIEKFSELRPDLYFPDEWSEEDREKAIEDLKPSKTKSAMFTSIPMKCKAEQCIFKDSCPLQQRDTAPKGKLCPIEMTLVMQFTEDYMDELRVESDNLVEVSMVRDLVDQEIQYIRKSKILAKEDFIQEFVVGIAPTGEIITSERLHLAVELEDKIHKRKSDLRKALMATREAKAKIGRGELDSAQTMSNIFEQIRQVDIEANKMIKLKMGNIHQDEYIDAQVIDETESKP